MSIIDQAQSAIDARRQAATDEDTIRRRESDARAAEANRRAEEFRKRIALPDSFVTYVLDGVLTINRRKRKVVEIRFGWNTRSEYESGEYIGEGEPFETASICYHAEWLREGGQEYQRHKARAWDDFYPDSEERQNELGEYLLRVLKNEFKF